MRCYFVKDGRVVADKKLHGLSADEAVKTSQKMLQERASLYNGAEVWSLTRRLCRLGCIARKPPPVKPSKPRKLFALRLALTE